MDTGLGERELTQGLLHGGGARAVWPLPSIGAYVALAIGLLVSLQLFYSTIYSVHTDLAGAALSGRLAVTLGDSFSNYSLYFPPAERAWFSLSVWLSDLTGMQLDLTVIMMAGVAVIFSVGLAFHIRQQTVGASPLFIVVSLALLVIIPVLYKNVFGLREHMVVLGLWPYIVLRISDPDNSVIGPKTRVLLGVWLGVTLLFKYLYSLVVLLVEIADAAVRRRPSALFRIENLISGGIVALYLFLWLVIDPAQREAIGAVVSAIDANLTSWQTNLYQSALHLALSFFFIALTVIYKLSVREAAIALAMVVAAIAASWIQSRWYSHHLFPIFMAYLAWLWIVHRHIKLLWIVAVAVVMARPVVGEFRNSAIYQVTFDEVEAAMDRPDLSIAGKRVGVLTMHPSPFNQYLATQGAIRWNASMNNSYVAAELKPLDRPENADMVLPPVTLDDPGRQMLHDDMLRLWEDMPPEILILDQSTSWPLEFISVEWKTAFANDDRFQAILAQYKPVFEHKGERLEFTYYVRIDAEQ
ncbi:hypothetical protein HKD42_02420 [Altererythrobacter sp. RZ02]|uniref:Uncharacterized protein n=1 Tax=Pontixanthobacter rizhaonensis TaxID=2730337 RepID=A0A848QJQ8_9SPHN|nr:hypothetical protein [Pontixanthobacter rizhaonensis]NMW30913.1 hypothetical protein [Pontixanthobacter rizhaonensis]